ncbi:MAG: tail fiber domain-containing protein [Burkholderiales bacterium]|nr:tail fiber domain-containing protein [Burkholderiales bacterium]
MRRVLLAVVAFAVGLSAVPGRAQICTPFTDVAASDPFCTSIQWMFNRGVTLGCHAPGQAVAYCPGQFVRRDQMAAFMNRLADDAVFQQGGNAFGGTAVLGTTDNQALDVIANNSRVVRYEPNAVSPNVIGGSPANNVTAGVRGATIAGGGVPPGDTDPDLFLEAPNRVTDAYGTVGGGFANRAGNDAGSTTDRPFATVAGGINNTANGSASTVGGGSGNTASGSASAVGGGTNGTASGRESTIAGGQDNDAIGAFSTVAGGAGNKAIGNFSVVAGGLGNSAGGVTSFAAGRAANAHADGCFVWGDVSTFNPVSCGGANTFVVRSVGGVFFISAGSTDFTYTGVLLLPGATAWVASSDRRLKENLQSVDTRDVLDRLLALPITTWNLKTQDPSIRHMGAMAQDFRAAFGLGESELGINTLDADGVALAAIQGLNAKLEAERAAKDAQIAAMRAELAQMRSMLAAIAPTR